MMRALAFVLVFVAACSPSAPAPTPTPTPPPPPAALPAPDTPPPSSTSTSTSAPSTSAPSTSSSAAHGDALAAAREACIVKTNEQREKRKIRFLLRNFPKEECADASAKAAKSSRGPGAKGGCDDLAQNVCAGHKGTPMEVVDACVAEIFKEGPGAGAAHVRYNNAISTKYPLIWCGFDTKPDGTTTLVQNFGDP